MDKEVTTQTEKKPLRKYDEEFIARAKDFAVLGLQPPQIAERMGLEGKERENFLFDCTNTLHPLHQLLNIAYAHGDDDIDAALITIACSGDVDALELAFKKRDQDQYRHLRKQLFGI